MNADPFGPFAKASDPRNPIPSVQHHPVAHASIDDDAITSDTRLSRNAGMCANIGL